MSTKRLIFFMLFCSQFIIAQNSNEQKSEKLINGKITNLLDLEGIYILNITKHSGTISNYSGDFSIYAALGDTLAISSIQFETEVIPVNDSIYQTQRIAITLKESITELEEVVINPYGLTGSLTVDLAAIPFQKEITSESLGLPHNNIKVKTKEERMLYAAKSSSGGIIPIGYMIMALNGELKKLKRNVELSKKSALLEKAKKIFDEVLLSQHFNFSEDYLGRFFEYCAMDENFSKALSKTEFEFLEYLETKVANFKEENNLK